MPPEAKSPRLSRSQKPAFFDTWPWIPRPGASPPLETPGEMWPRVTMVTPSFNQAKTLEATILSVLQGGYPNLEYMVIDGGSTDESEEVIRKYRTRLAYWVSEPDRGQSDAINKGWRRATGDYLWWLNADDMLTPDSLFRSVAFLERHPNVDMVYGDVYRIDGAGAWLGEFRYKDFDFETFVTEWRDLSQAGALTRRRGFDKVGYLDEDLHYLMDRDFWQRLALAGGVIIHRPFPLAFFRIHDESKTQAGSPRAAEERLRVTERLLEDPSAPAWAARRRGKIWSNAHLTCSRVLVKHGDYVGALEALGEAVHRMPGQILRWNFWYALFQVTLGLSLGKRRWIQLRALVRKVRRTLGLA